MLGGRSPLSSYVYSNVNGNNLTKRGMKYHCFRTRRQLNSSTLGPEELIVRALWRGQTNRVVLSLIG